MTRLSITVWFRVVAAVIVMAVGGIILNEKQLEGRLLRADPDGLPKDAGLMNFGIVRGASVFDSRCAVCHGTAGHGNTVQGIPDLTDGDWLYGSGQVSEIERVVSYGIRSHNPKAWNLAVMPAYAQPVPSITEPKIPPLAPDEINDVIDYLGVAGSQANSAARERGAALYYGKGGCYDCHGPDLRGDTAIGAPNLIDAT